MQVSSHCLLHRLRLWPRRLGHLCLGTRFGCTSHQRLKQTESTDRGWREAQLRKAGSPAPVWPPWGVSLAHKTRDGSQLRPCPYHQRGQEEGCFLSCRRWHQLLPAPWEDVSCLPSPCDSSRGGGPFSCVLLTATLSPACAELQVVLRATVLILPRKTFQN